jgi:hypothetical protein
MTAEQFLNGTSFTVGAPRYKGAETFKYDNGGGCIIRESRSSRDQRVLFVSHECNTIKIGRTGFTGFTFIVNKRVNIKYRFEDLVVFEETVGE